MHQLIQQHFPEGQGSPHLSGWQYKSTGFHLHRWCGSHNPSGFESRRIQVRIPPAGERNEAPRKSALSSIAVRGRKWRGLYSTPATARDSATVRVMGKAPIH
ncbi:MAG: hypothetical protein ACOX45_09225 [Acutalibacteraceae bacterium]